MAKSCNVLVEVVLARAAVSVGSGGRLLLRHIGLPSVVLADGGEDVATVRLDEAGQEASTSVDVEGLKSRYDP